MIQPSIVAAAFEQFRTNISREFKLKSIFFDMDGVLYHSMPMHAKSWLQAFKENGLVIDETEPYLNEGATAIYTVKAMFKKYLGKEVDEATAERIKSRKHEIMSGLPLAGVMPGMPELLKLIEKSGLDIWVVTGSAQDSLLNRLEREFPGSLFRHKMVTAHDVTHGKPNPEPYLRAIEKSGYSTSEAIVIENAPLGVESAKAAGLFTIAINTGPLLTDVLVQAGADLVLPGSDSLIRNWNTIRSIIM
jgi:HAD superfamily hydrolase (TIGR01509 family)